MDIHYGRFCHVPLILIDLVALAVAWSLSIGARVLLSPWPGRWVGWSDARIWAPSLITTLALWIALCWRLRVYRAAAVIDIRSVLIRAAEGAILASAIIVVVTFFSRELGAGISRSFFIIFALIVFVSLSVARYAGTFVGRHWLPPVRLAILGDAFETARLVNSIGFASTLGAVKGLIVPEGHSIDNEALPFPVLGTTAQLGEVINRDQLDRIILLSGSFCREELEACNKILKRMSVIVSCTVDLAPELGRVNVVKQYGLPLVELRPRTSTKSREIVKRTFDIAASTIALVVLAPVMLLTAVLVKMTSDGPILYRSARVGRGGRYFMFLKFRSMYDGKDRMQLVLANEKRGHIFKMRQDPRVTPIGRIIRRYSLDELPQLINVLRGEMSLVGPRPLPANDLDPDGMSRKFAAWSEERSEVYPGITGLWQVNGRSELSFEEMVRLDLEYIRDWSLMLDLKILLATPGLVLKGVGAY